MTKRRLALHWKILIGLVIGIAAGLVCDLLVPRDAQADSRKNLAWVVLNIAKPIGTIFLRLILMIVIPLVFTALVLGIAGLGDVRRLGRIGLVTLGLTVLLSAASVAIGLTLVNTLTPGDLLSQERRAELRDKYAGGDIKAVRDAQKAKPLRETLVDLVPANPLQEAVGALDGSSPGGGMLAFMVFSLIFGVALTMVGERAAGLISTLEGLYDVSMTVIGMAMRLAPFAVANLMFALTAELGLDIVKTLGGYVATVIGGLSVQMLVVYPIALLLFSSIRPYRFFKGISEAFMTALGTSSSNATLPTSIRVARDELKLRPAVGNFVLTVGSTANQNGTALFEGVTVLFLAQVFGIELTLGQQVTVAMMCLLAGIGTAGVPGGSLPLIVLVLQSVNIPGEAIGIILGVDRILDMCRTTVNVTGDLAIAACVDNVESAFEKRTAAAVSP